MEQRKSLGKEAGARGGGGAGGTSLPNSSFSPNAHFISFALPQLIFLSHTKSNVLCLSPTPTGSPEPPFSL